MLDILTKVIIPHANRFRPSAVLDIGQTHPRGGGGRGLLPAHQVSQSSSPGGGGCHESGLVYCSGQREYLTMVEDRYRDRDREIELERVVFQCCGLG